MFQLDKNYGNKKLQQILETSLELFWKFGYNRVTIEEICQKAPASKNTFYKHFENKFALIKFIMREAFRKGLEDYEAIMAEEICFEEKIKKIIDLKLKNTGDMSADFFRDLYLSGDEEIIRLIREMTEESMGFIHNSLKEFQRRGEIRIDINLNFILYYLNNMQNMIKDQNLVNLYESPSQMIQELTSFFFYGILPRERERK